MAFLFGMFMLIFALIILVISFVIAGFQIAGMWKVFSKAGYPGWASLIPIYNYVVLLKISKLSPLYALLFILPIIASIMSFFLEFASYSSSYYSSVNSMNMFFFTMIYALVSMAYSICFAVLQGFISYRVAKCFNQGAGMAVGLYFLPYVFYPILGFCKNYTYTPYGEEPKTEESAAESNSNTETESEVKVIDTITDTNTVSDEENK